MNIIINPDQTVKPLQISDVKITIKDFQDIIGKPFEILYLPLDESYIIYNDDKKGKTYNVLATNKVVDNYPDTKIQVYGKAIQTKML
tara:strand:+ start:3537 stop:3797 length:261 start_codon:yes stop_codon:yes gene_type:complete